METQSLFFIKIKHLELKVIAIFAKIFTCQPTTQFLASIKKLLEAKAEMGLSI